jgi:hypothetical protein
MRADALELRQHLGLESGERRDDRGDAGDADDDAERREE